MNNTIKVVTLVIISSLCFACGGEDTSCNRAIDISCDVKEASLDISNYDHCDPISMSYEEYEFNIDKSCILFYKNIRYRHELDRGAFYINESEYSDIVRNPGHILNYI